MIPGESGARANWSDDAEFNISGTTLLSLSLFASIIDMFDLSDEFNADGESFFDRMSSILTPFFTARFETWDMVMVIPPSSDESSSYSLAIDWKVFLFFF